MFMIIAFQKETAKPKANGSTEVTLKRQTQK